MRSRSWIELIRRIPPELHNDLALLTTIGQEITFQDLLRIEEEFLVVRGRLAGTLESGRVFFVPYDQINFLGFQSAMTELQIQALFAGRVAAKLAPPPPVEPPPAPEPAPATDSQPAPVPVYTPLSAPGPESTAKPADSRLLPSRKALLERLRLRNRQSDGSSASPSSA